MKHFAQIRYDDLHDRMVLGDNELHCGQCLEVLVASETQTSSNQAVWIKTRLEMGADWYLVGLQDLQINGLFARLP